MAINTLINQTFGGAIWRMEIDELSEILFIETRSNEERQTAFSAISLLNGQTCFMDITTPERWLTGIEAAYDGVLMLHNYQSESGPTHKGVIAIDALTGTELWSNYIFAFDHLSTAGPVLYDSRIHPRKLFLADAKTGATTRLYEPSVYKVMDNNVEVPAMAGPDLIPEALMPMHPYGNMIHYLEYNNYRIVSLHALKGGQLTQWLFITDGLSKVYEDLINHDIQKIQPEAFIVHKNRLLFIKNKSELIVLTL